MALGETLTAIAENPVFKALWGFIKEMAPAGLMDWYFLGKHARRNEEGKRVVNIQYQDEMEYRRIAAIVRDKLRREKKGKEPLVDEVDAFMATLASHEAFTFRECLLQIKNEDEKILAFLEVVYASPEARMAKIKAITQHPAIIKWFLEEILEAIRRYKAMIAGLSAPIADALQEFVNSLKIIERIQWQIAIGDIKDDTKRMIAIREIIKLPVDQRHARAVARGYINKSIIRAPEEMILGLYKRLEVPYTAWLDKHAVAAQAGRDQQVARMKNPPRWNLVARGINRLF